MKSKVRVEREIKIGDNNQTLCSYACSFCSPCINGEDYCVLFSKTIKKVETYNPIRCKKCLESEIKVRPNIITGA